MKVSGRTKSRLSEDIGLLDRCIHERWIPLTKGEKGSSCVLCEKYGGIAEEDVCIGCPISVYVARPQCRGTPYYDYHDWPTPYKAKRMLNFLYTVRSTLEAELDYKYKHRGHKPKLPREPKQPHGTIIKVGDIVKIIDWSSQLQLDTASGELVTNWEPATEKQDRKYKVIAVGDFPADSSCSGSYTNDLMLFRARCGTVMFAFSKTVKKVEPPCPHCGGLQIEKN